MRVQVGGVLCQHIIIIIIIIIITCVVLLTSYLYFQGGNFVMSFCPLHNGKNELELLTAKAPTSEVSGLVKDNNIT